jgi:hypothetical protein
MGSLRPEDVARRLADALERDHTLLIMPPVLKPMYHLRQIPSRVTDLLTHGIR